MENYYIQASDIVKNLYNYLHSFLFVELILSILFIVLIIFACSTKNNKIAIILTLCILIIVILANQLWLSKLSVYPKIIFNSLYYDDISINFKTVILLSGFLTALCVLFDKSIKKFYIPEIFSIIILATIGGCLLVASYNLLMILVALETISIAIYIMCAFFSNEKTSISGTYKYLIFNIVLTLIFVYSISLLYGLNRNIFLNNSMFYFADNKTIPSYFIFSCFISVLLFKLFIFPFNFLAPEIYKAASISGINFLSTISKVSFFGFLYRIISFFDVSDLLIIHIILIICAAISLLFGSYCALKQINVKSLLGYGAVSDSGFLFYIIILSSLHQHYIALPYIIYYLIVYVVSISGLCLAFTGINRGNNYNITNYIGVFKEQPYTFVFLLSFIVSLIGLPPTAGFLSKLLLLVNVIGLGKDIYILVFMALFIVYSVITIVYYLRILTYMIKRADYLVSLKVKHVNFYRHVLCFILLIVIIVLLIYPFPK